jgi:hypothetical protein
MPTDNQLLRDYARHRSESAFTELVRRHVDTVCSAALRETHGDITLAQDITQAVFTELALKASRLRFSHTQFTSIQGVEPKPDGTLRLSFAYRDPDTGRTNPLNFSMRLGESGWKVVIPGPAPRELPSLK